MRQAFWLRGCKLALAVNSCWQQNLVASQAANAQDGLEEIIVTAQRRAENLQDVPIAAAVLTGDMLAEKGVTNIVELQYAAPGFTVADYGSANVLNIRGIGRSAVDIELPSGVVVYRDGFPTFPGYFQNEPYYDIASIEILRGPQGTFAGKSAAGGAILIRTASPELGQTNGKVDAEIGNYQYWGATGVLNIPLGDTFAMRAALHHDERGEYLVDSLDRPVQRQSGRDGLEQHSSGRVVETE
jgi:iron complex outermembrane receptor protein